MINLTGTTNEVDFYGLTERPAGCVAFKVQSELLKPLAADCVALQGEGDIAVSVSTLLLYLLDANQHKEFDADWDSPVFRLRYYLVLRC